MDAWNSRNGQSVFEVVIAIALFVLITSASVTLLTVSLVESEAGRQRARADNLLQEGLEATRQIRNREWELLTPGTYGLLLSGTDWIFSGTSDTTDDMFVRTVTIVQTDADQRDITVSVTWAPRQGRTVVLDTTARLTNWKNVEVWGNWGNPYVVGSTDIGPQGKATDVAFIGTHVFLTAESSSDGRPSLFSIDVSVPTDLTIVAEVETGDNLADVVALEDTQWIYTVGTESDSELRVFDISNPTDPSQITARDLSAIGHSATIDASTLYVGAANGLHIFDISDPENPLEIGSLALGTDARDVAVIDGYAYIATPDNEKEVIIVDVSDPTDPTSAGEVNLSGSLDALSVAVHASKLYVGRYNNPSTNPEIYILDRTNPTAPTLLASIDNGGDVNAMIPIGPYLFTATAVSNREFTIYNVSNPLAPTIEASLNMSNIATGLDFVDNTIYISLRSNDAFQIIQPRP